MSTNKISAVEALHNTFFYFAEGLTVMASDATKQRELIGGAHVAWELQNDVKDFGETLLNCAGPFFLQSERTGIVSLLDKIKKLPPDALRSDDKALIHPQWEALRIEAAHLLLQLARPIVENQAFFNK
ncbi:MAG: hypothetical protein EON92_00265 [Burkholderiales bacterium]|nr:MAG: hypothetical protein EON92_00265 [Burkholderiales bacterium]